MAFRSPGTLKIFQKRITQQDIVEEDLLWCGEAFSSSGKLKLQFVSGQQKAANYVKMLNDLSLVQEGHRLCGEEWIFSKIMLLSPMHQLQRITCLNKKKTFWQHSGLSRSQSYRKFVGIDCCKSLWSRSTVLCNFSTQKRNLRYMGKISLVQLWKLVDSMPISIFEIMKANGGSTKY